MKENKTLLSYILGMISIIALIPLIESLVEVICGYIELLKIHSTKSVLKGNKDILDLQVEQSPVDSVAMGFQIPSEDDDFYDDDDELEDVKKNHFKCGFH